MEGGKDGWTGGLWNEIIKEGFLGEVGLSWTLKEKGLETRQRV